MRGKILLIINELRFSYWFIPTIMAIGAILLSIATVWIDSLTGADWINDAGWLYANQPAGARALLSTIAGSMITVAGVTFSITVAAVASSTNQFGPRLLTNFLRDRGNQITLGTFIATFLYCLLVLRTVVSADEAEQAFVPNIAILFALLLALASVGVLIFFLHHVPQSVHVSHMIARVGQELIEEVDKLFPRRIGEPPSANDGSSSIDELEQRFDAAYPIRATGCGYMQQVDGAHLMKVVSEESLIIKIDCRPGTFVRQGQPLARILASEPPDEVLKDRLVEAFTWHVKRSPTQDIMFLVDQLVEIAARALSPGLNDPFTAMNCLEWLTAALAAVADRDVPDGRRFDDDGDLRIVARPVRFADLAEAGFGALLPYIAADRNAASHAMRKLASLADDLRTDEQRAAIQELAAAYLAASQRELRHPSGKAEIAALYAVFRQRSPLSDR